MGRSGQQALNLGLEGLHGGALRRKVKRRKGEGEGGEGGGRTSWAVVGEQHGAESIVRGRGSFVGRDTILREDMLVIKWKKDGWMDGRRTWAASGSVDISRDGTGWSRAEQAGTGEREGLLSPPSL